MKTDQPQPVRLSEYQPFPFEVPTTKLSFDLFETATIVRSELELVRKPDVTGSLVLDGIGLELLAVEVDGQKLKPAAYQLDEETLTISNLPDRCTLSITTRFSPEENLALSGLYMSGGRFCTQCEAQGFRHITYYPDRPDVMSTFEVRLEADKAFPTLLSNGNLLDSGELSDHRHFALWQDPFKKPAYLFALVGGAFDMIEDHFVTMSDKEVPLRIYVDPGDAKYADYAMDSLKRAMKWDEDVFGREYDLDLFMIVAVRSFNFGAMENKGLNIFNSSVLLANAETATDADFERIESVVAHEYFHNWTGNRITCRDWFQLCLKEGLTVFRDQEFSADQRGRAITRIKDVKALRARQFAEDAGPLAHPVRPSSYLAIDNFYTATVYEKGAELIRALKTILGDENFAKGMDRYFDTCDGTATTMEVFLDCFATASGQDLSKFLLWYGQAGTPVVTITESWNEQENLLSVTFEQSTPATPGQAEKQSVPIPIRLGLLGENGPVEFSTSGETGSQTTEITSVLDTKSQTIQFDPLPSRPVLSAFREFSAPVIVKQSRTATDQALIISSDPDLFSRWEEAQSFGRSELRTMTRQVIAEETPSASAAYVEAITSIIANRDLEPAFVALAMQPPGQSEIFLSMKDAVPEAIAKARDILIQQVTKASRQDLQNLQQSMRPIGTFSPDAEAAGRRALANQALVFVSSLSDMAAQELAWKAWQSANNMTDAMAALVALDVSGSDGFQKALSTFYEKWHTNPLVLDKWFFIQATAKQTGTVDDIRTLLAHPDFNTENPNRTRAIYGAFAMGNLTLFHAKSGDGYNLLAEGILQIDPHNAALAARLTGAFESWRQVEPGRRKIAKSAIRKIRDTKGLSKNTFEIASRHLK
jgi:aminopeptidase N